MLIDERAGQFNANDAAGGVEAVAMPDNTVPVPVGSTGTVTFVNEHGTGATAWLRIGVAWDDGRRLMLSVPPDEFEVV